MTLKLRGQVKVNNIVSRTKEGAPSYIGQAWQGGYFAGLISSSANGQPTHYLVISPKSSGEIAAPSANSYVGNSISGATSQGNTSEWDGLTNTSIMADGNHPAADTVRTLNIGGFQDWYIPSIMELDIIYFYLKPTTDSNYTSVGTNNYSVPIRTVNFTSSNPSQTPEVRFQSPFGSEMFHTGTYPYWSSTQKDSVTQYYRNFSNGLRGYDFKMSPQYVRAIRRVPYPFDDLVSIGQSEYTFPGSYYWTAPAKVFAISVVCVGAGGAGGCSSGGGGGGGGLGWKNNIPVVPGQQYLVQVGLGGVSAVSNFNSSGTSGNGGDSYFISTSTVAGFGGKGGSYYNINNLTHYVVAGGNGGGFVGDGGGTGGKGGGSDFDDLALGGQGGSGGGAGGYTGNGGRGGTGYDSNGGSLEMLNAAGNQGNGGGGGGGGAGLGIYGNGNGTGAGTGGGGTGLKGQGANGSFVSWNIGSPADATVGNGGSGGGNGSENNNSFTGGQQGGAGGYPGGGGGGGMGFFNGVGGPGTGPGGSGGNGGVRIIWGPDRAFPTTNTQDIF